MHFDVSQKNAPGLVGGRAAERVSLIPCAWPGPWLAPGSLLALGSFPQPSGAVVPASPRAWLPVESYQPPETQTAAPLGSSATRPEGDQAFLGICGKGVFPLSQPCQPRDMGSSWCAGAPSLPLLPHLLWKGDRTGCGTWPSPDPPPEVARTHWGDPGGDLEGGMGCDPGGGTEGAPGGAPSPGSLWTCCHIWGWPCDLWGHPSCPSPLCLGCPQGSQPPPGMEPKLPHFLLLMLPWFLLNQVINVGH